MGNSEGKQRNGGVSRKLTCMNGLCSFIYGLLKAALINSCYVKCQERLGR